MFGLRRGDTEIVDSYASVDTYACAAPIVVDDVFDNADLAMPGPSSVGPGFVAVTNAVGNGSSTERPGGMLELRTSNNTATAAPAQGIATSTSVPFDANGMTMRLEVTAADSPRWHGIAIALQTRQANVDAAGDSLVLRVRGPHTNPFAIDVGNQDPYAMPWSLEAYDEQALVDGFTVTWHIRPMSWRYVVDGLRVDGTQISTAGSFSGGKMAAELLPPSVYLALHIQGDASDINQRIMKVRRLTLWDGDCP